jgi:TolA-binding protein
VREKAVSLQDEAILKSLQVEPPARTLFAKAERAFKAKRYKAAVDGYRTLKARFPGSAAHQVSSYRLGSLYYTTGNYPQAAQEFQSHQAAFPKSVLAFDVAYNLAAAEYQQQHFDKAYEALRRLTPDAIRAQGNRRADVVYQLAAQSASALGNHPGTIYYHAAQLQLPIDPSRRPPLEASIAHHLGQMS